MTTKLLNFKKFLEKGASKKPCGPGEHRHWGYDYCHKQSSKHHKHLKIGIDPHHGMDAFTGHIPEGTAPPNIQDHHVLAKPHASKGGKCKPSEYPKGSGKTVPFHRHSGADYCHAVTQKHGLTAEVAQSWHDNNAALIQESWYLFNESEGLPQPETIPDETTVPADAEYMPPEESSYGGYFEPKDDAAESPKPSSAVTDEGVSSFADTIESQGTPTNPHNVQIGDTITVLDISGATTYHKIIDISWGIDGKEHAQSNFGPLIDLSNKEVTGVSESVTDSYGPAIDSNNPHELQIGSVFTDTGGTKFKVSSINIDPEADGGGSVQYTAESSDGSPLTASEAGQESTLKEFNHFISSHTADWEGSDIEHPGIPDSPPGEYTGEIAISDLSTGHIELAPKIGEIVTGLTLQDVVVGTTLHLAGTEGGNPITIISNQTANQVLTVQPEGLPPYPISYHHFTDDGNNEFIVSGLDSQLKNQINHGFNLGGKVTNDNLMSLPAGLMFAFTIEGKPVVATIVAEGIDGIYSAMDLTFTESGMSHSNVKVSSLSDIVESSQQDDLKIVGLPSGEAVQHVSEPMEPVAINKHGLDKGTTLTVKNAGGTVSSAEIVKTHKTKTGQNYTLKYTDGPYEGTEIKISSKSSKLSTEAYSDKSTGAYVYVDEAQYKPGEEPEQASKLTLPPLGSEGGNWDDVLEQIGGKQGYNEGGTFKHSQTGDEFYIKFSSSGNSQQVASEDLANKLYMLLGVDTLGTSLIDFQGKMALKSPIDKDLTKININDMSNEPEIMDNFVVDAWLANWDVIGPQNDNIQKSGNKIIKVDSGGSLTFGGAGGKKAFGSEVVELESMRDPTKAKVAHTVFSQISEQNLVTGAQKISQVTDQQIDAIVKASKISNKSKMASLLKARRDDIVQKILNTDTATAAKTGGKPGQHEHAGYSGWHSKTQKHAASNTAANAAHKELGLPFKEEGLGSTLTPDSEFWTMLGNSSNSEEIKTMATEALAHDFGTTGSTSNVRSAISKFLKANNIEDTFSNVFHSWQGGSSTFARIKTNAAIAKLKGVDGQIKSGEASHWVHERGVTHFSEAWEEGTSQATAMIPYIAASQQKIKALTGVDGTLKRVYRGLSGDISSTAKKAHKAAKSAKVQRVYIGGGGQGFSLNKKTAKNFAGGDGVMFSKDSTTSSDVLLYFNSWNTGFTGEEELILDPSATQEYSLNELHYAGEPGW